MAKEFKVPSRKQPIWKPIRKVFEFFGWRNIKVELLTDKIEEKSIIVSNHSAKKGPMGCEIALPVFNVKWGAHEMLGNYRSRWNYLVNVFYTQKQKMKPLKAKFKATFEAIFSKRIYTGMKFIGTYPDGRLKITIRNSIKVLEDNKAILVFPEDSNDGYFDVMTSFFPGFVMLSEQYYKLHGEDLPVYPIYYHHKSKRLIVDKPLYIQELIKQGMSRKEIAEHFCNLVNNLYFKYIENK
jgi:hypothetical protein